MKPLVVILLILIAKFSVAQTTDSIDIKLQQYKYYYDNGLISPTDYDLLKEKLLHIGKYAPHKRVLDNYGVAQYDKNTTFEIRVEPAILFGLPYTYKTQGYHSLNGNNSFTEKKQSLEYGAIDFAFGAAFFKRYHIHLNLGFDGNRELHEISVGVDANINLIKGKVSPFIHWGGGYASTEILNNDESALNGCYAGAGMGVFIQLTRFCALSISPDYRFIYGKQKQRYSYYNNGVETIAWKTDQIFIHQIGVRMAAVFY